ncbi:SRPBCC domain-containing protein [uncultured Paraglaciecola sp.]|uniref:SRPBCC domain-containing protein n=1 Tax=uncultured Paraglaciecola sp. TaxID=1765024 RepID=UPI0030D97D70|tara:strand:+ start:93688 stop:94119 length:432 start_codon:yes stop_codon:yes gene_type:complete
MKTQSDIDSIVREVTFNAPIEKVWNAITCPKAIQQWFGSAASFELKQGQLGYFEWEQECEGRFAMRIETITPPHYFAWRWMFQQDAVFDEATSTLVEWSLTATEKGGTHLLLTESGFLQPNHKQANIKGWTQEIADLQRYLDN